MNKTIAQDLNGKVVESLPDKCATEWGKKVYEFVDGSKAYVLTTFEDCPPRQTGSLSTISKIEVYRWKVVE